MKGANHNGLNRGRRRWADWMYRGHVGPKSSVTVRIRHLLTLRALVSGEFSRLLLLIWEGGGGSVVRWLGGECLMKPIKQGCDSGYNNGFLPSDWAKY